MLPGQETIQVPRGPAAPERRASQAAWGQIASPQDLEKVTLELQESGMGAGQ